MKLQSFVFLTAVLPHESECKFWNEAILIYSNALYGGEYDMDLALLHR
ncbi:hypothetical protein [Nitratifractor sp.]